MRSRRSKTKVKPAPNKLILPGLILSCLPAVAAVATFIHPSLQPYLLYFLPFGIIAAVLARISLKQVKYGPGMSREHRLELITYFLGLAPVLYFLGVVTYALLHH